jgi:hypothetical protein
MTGKLQGQLPMQRVGRHGGVAPNHKAKAMGSYVIEMQGWLGT